MLGYLPALQAPNMRLDFSPIDDAIGGFFKQQKERRQNNALVGLIDSLNGPGAQGPNMPANALSAQPAVPGPASTGLGPQPQMNYGISGGAHNAMFDMGNLGQSGGPEQTGLSEYGVPVSKALQNGGSRMNLSNIDGEFGGRLKSALDAMPPDMRQQLEINEAWRSPDYQAELYNKYKNGQGGLAAPPGKSRHNTGQAVDFSPPGGYGTNYDHGKYDQALNWLYQNGSQYGIENPQAIRGRDPHHFQMSAGGPAANPAVTGSLQPQPQQSQQPVAQQPQPVRTADASGGIDPKIMAWMRSNPDHPATKEILTKILEQRTDPMLGLKLQQAKLNVGDSEIEHETKVARAYGRVAQSVLGETDPQKQAAMNQHLIGSHPELAKILQQHGIDPNDSAAAAKFLIERAQEYEDPVKEETKKINLQILKKTLNAKDYGEVKEVDGTLVRIAPDKNSASVVYGGGTGKLPQGYMRDPKNPGAFVPVPGGPGDHLTEGESKDALFAERMLRSERDLASVIPTDAKGNFTKYNPTGAAQNYAPDDPSWKNLWTANFFNSKEWQQYRRAARESLSAILRKDTGAAVTDEEFNTYFPTYFPVPGDSAEVVKQKENARHVVAQGLRGASSRAFGRMFPNYDALNGSTPQAGGGKVHDLGDGFTLEVH